MPIYEFKCPACGALKEQILPLGTNTLVCPSCGQAMDKLISAPAFKVMGFNAQTGYSGERTFVKKHTTGKLAGIRTEVKGHPEGFADGLHK